MSIINEALKELRNLKEDIDDDEDEIDYLEDESLIEDEEADLQDICEYISKNIKADFYGWSFNPKAKEENTWSIYFCFNKDNDVEKRFTDFIKDEFSLDGVKFIFDDTNNYIWTGNNGIEIITGKEAKDRFADIYCNDSDKVFVINIRPDLNID